MSLHGKLLGVKLREAILALTQLIRDDRVAVSGQSHVQFLRTMNPFTADQLGEKFSYIFKRSKSDGAEGGSSSAFDVMDPSVGSTAVDDSSKLLVAQEIFMNDAVKPLSAEGEDGVSILRLIGHETKQLYDDYVDNHDDVPPSVVTMIELCEVIKVATDPTSLDCNFSIVAKMDDEFNAGTKTPLADMSFYLKRNKYYEAILTDVLHNLQRFKDSQPELLKHLRKVVATYRSLNVFK